MAWFQLDPESITARAKAAGTEVHVPSLTASVWRGTIGFTIVSVAGFVPWAIFGRSLHRLVGELGMYLGCMAVFIGLSGLLMHRLILGPGSLSRFYKLFSAAFAAYSVGWMAGWMVLRGHPGSIAGLLAGTAMMGWMMTRAFDARDATFKVIAVLFVLNSLGYFIGGWAEAGVMGMKEPTLFGVAVARKVQVRTAMLLWGVFYGLGFGAGLGWAFHLCQGTVRRSLAGAAGQK
jgi:hypothetical protein